MRILGIDPGLKTTGYAVVDFGVKKSKFTKKGLNNWEVIDYGVIDTDKTDRLSMRLAEIYQGIGDIIDKYVPTKVAVESLFFCNNQKTAMLVGQARGVVLLACEQAGLNFLEFTPRQVKQAVVGYGLAPKNQIQFMVKELYNLKEEPKPDDAADALAVCYCAMTNN
ncbi:MAG: crossover junction endodeoxyribonuclease RuvC [Patescibacteria group bacterium]